MGSRHRSLAIMGLDVGQRVDPTALAVVEASWVLDPSGRTVVRYTVRFLHRPALGTPYPEVADWIVQVSQGVVQQTGRPPSLYMDATGVGIPLMDALIARRVQATVFPCFFNYGDKL